MFYKANESNDLEEIANMFADFFGDAYESSGDNQIDEDDFNYLNGCKKVENMSHIAIERHTLLCAIKSMKSITSTGPDGIPSIMLKECSESLSVPLLI